MPKAKLPVSLLTLFAFVSLSGCQQGPASTEPLSKNVSPPNEQASTGPQLSFAEPVARQAPPAAGSNTDNLVWSDEFEGDSLDLKKWKFETGGNGWGNNELQTYTDGANVEVSDGTLKITAQQIRPGAANGNFTSARLNSLQSFQYGRLEAKARIPKLAGKGIWPAIWMLSESYPKTPWPLCGEIDIMEYVSCTPDKVHFAVHSKTHNHMTGTHKSSGPISLPTIDEQFHVYGFTWSAEKIQFYIDQPSNIQFTVERPKDVNEENWPFDQPYYFLLNVAVGGSWGGMHGVEDSAFPSTMEIDYVRVYQK